MTHPAGAGRQGEPPAFLPPEEVSNIPLEIISGGD